MDTLLTHTLIPIVISEHTAIIRHVYWFCTIPFGQRYLRLTTYCTFTLLSYSLFIRFTHVMCRVQKEITSHPYIHTNTNVQKHNERHYTLRMLPKA